MTSTIPLQNKQSHSEMSSEDSNSLSEPAELISRIRTDDENEQENHDVVSAQTHEKNSKS